MHHPIVAALGAALIVLSLAACGRDTPSEPKGGVVARTDCPAPGTADYYLPPGVLVPAQFIGRPLREAYAEFLAALREPSLYCGAVANETYRLSRLEWVGVPVFIRATLLTRGARLSVKKLEAPAWNLPPGKVLEDRTVTLSSLDRESFATARGLAEFWAMPSVSGSIDTAIGEGTTWVLEGRRASSYHVVSRWLPQDSPFLSVSRALLGLAGVKEAELGPDAPGVILRPSRPQRDTPPPPSPYPPGNKWK